MKNIGVTFGDDLIAAGLNDGVSWDDAKVYFRDDIKQATRDQVLVLLQAHDPSAKPERKIDEVTALKQALIAKGVIDAQDVEAQTEKI